MRPFLTLVLVCLLTGLFFSYLAMASLPVLFDLSIADLSENPDEVKPPEESSRLTLALFLVQGLSSLGFFVLPGWWFIQNYREWTRTKFGLLISAGLSGIGITVACLPMVYNLFYLNQGLPYSPVAEAFPAFREISLAWQETEKSSQQLLILLLRPEGYLFWILGIAVLAVLPALGEELVFRGSLQPLLQQYLRSRHAGVWIAALVFSAIHGQWLGFVPRCLLGALFGYMVIWSGSLWPAILGHLINNLLSLLAFKLNWFGFADNDPEHLSGAAFRWDDNPFPWAIALVLTGMAGVALFHFRKSMQASAESTNAEEVPSSSS
jgi:membrane protease YdiL (CAAX protease family)